MSRGTNTQRLTSLLLAFAPFIAAQPGVLTFHNDSARTGQNLQETILTPVNVKPSTFGKLFTINVDGKVDAQPLYVPGVPIPASGTHNVLYVVTEHASAYAFDADTGAQLWKVSLLAVGETPSDDRGCFNVTPEIGATATPVIDLAQGPNGTIYVVAMSKDAVPNYHQRLHALDLSTGAERLSGPTEIAATYPGNGGEGANGLQTFDPKQHLERAGLALFNGVVYTSWASHCDISPYTGWVIGYDAFTLAKVSTLNVVPNGDDGGIWMSGAAPASDATGLYIITGNGNFDQTLDANGFPIKGDYGNAFIKIGLGGTAVLDYFAMSNTDAESLVDKDFGSGGALLLPPLNDAQGHARLLAVGAGKDRIIYVVDRGNMGKFSLTGDSIYQEINGALTGGVFSSPAWWNGTLYIGAVGDRIKAFSFSGGSFNPAPASQTLSGFPFPGTTPTISANGVQNGILWAAENTFAAALHAFDATNLASEIYNSNMAPGNRDAFGAGNKFIVPTVVNGKVYIGTTSGVGVFGLLCTYAISPQSVTLPTTGSSGTLNLTTQAGCAWTAVSNVPWITITSAPAGAGNATVAYSVAAATASRTGTITVGSQTFTIQQSADSSSLPAPVVSAVTVTSTTSSTATVTWTTDQASTSQILYGPSASYGLQTTLNTALVTSHTVTITGLTPATTYNFAAVSGNTTSPNFTFDTPAAVGAPVITQVTATAISSNSATITWTTDQASTSQVTFATNTSSGSQSAQDPSLVTSHSVTLNGLNAGTAYNYAVISSNSTGSSTTSAAFPFTTVPATIPGPVINGVSATSITPTTATIVWNTDQASTSQVAYGTAITYGSQSTLSNALVTGHSVALAGLAPGTTYNFTSVSINAAGGVTSSPNLSFTTPTATPVISGLTATNITATTATIVWTTDQTSTSQVAYGPTTTYTLQAGNNTLVTAHAVTLTGLNSGGAYYYAVTSSSGLGTTSSNNLIFSTPLAAPVIGAITVTAVTSTTATIAWTTDQLSSTQVLYGFGLNYGSQATTAGLSTLHSVTLSGLAAGASYNYAVVSVNASALTTTSTNASFVTLPGPPNISAVAATTVTATTATISWTTDQPASTIVNYGLTGSYGQQASASSGLSTSHAVTLTGLTAGTPYNYDVVSTNATNSTTTSPNATFTTLTPAPVISGITLTGITATSALVSWTTDQPASTLVNYGTTSTYSQQASVNSGLSTAHAVTLSGLISGTVYNYAVTSANASNGTTSSNNGTFATLSVAPVISAIAATSITTTAATVSWTTDQPASTQVLYGLSNLYGQQITISSGPATAHSVVLTGLTAGTIYNYAVISANASSMSTQSANLTFATLPPAPVISALSATAVTPTTATISWTTDLPSTTQVTYGTTTTTLNPTLTTAHSVALTGLTPSTTYSYAAISGVTTSAPLTFVTLPPSALISALTATAITPTSATISWTTDIPATTQVTYGTSTTTLNTTPTTAHSVTLTGLTPSTTYPYAALSTNATGTTTTSASQTFATLAPAPIITNIAASLVTSTTATISWITDIPSTTQLTYGAITTTLNTTLVTAHSVGLSGLTPGTTYTYSVTSASAGSPATVANLTFTTLPPAAVISSLTASAITPTSATITWTTDQPATTQVTYGTVTTTLDATFNTTHSVTLTGLTASTTYTYAALSSNATGTATTSVSQTFATLPPAPIISAVTATAITPTTATITWTTDIASTSQVTYGTTTTPAIATPVTAHSVSLVGLSPSTTYTYTALSSNGASTATSASLTFATLPPAAVITNVTASAITTTTAIITWTTDIPSTSQVTYGASTTAPNLTPTAAHTVTLTGLTPGTTYTYSALSTNATGTTTTSPNATFATLQTPAIISGLTASAITATTATITWNTDIPATSQANYGTTSTTINPSLSTSHFVNLTGLTPGTAYSYAALSTNSTGATTTSPNQTFTTLPPPPVITSVTAANITGTSATISWTTDIPSTSQVTYNASTTATNQTLAASHSITLTGLNPGTTYTYAATSAGATGSSATSANQSFTTLPAPIISAVTATNITAMAATITWTTNVVSTSQLIYGAITTTANPALTIAHSVALTGLTPNTTYTYSVISASAAGVSATSANFTFVTPALPPAVITSVSATSITSTSAVVIWTTDIPSTSQVNYGATGTLGSQTILNGALVTAHAVTLTNLGAGTAYSYQARSGNSQGIVTSSANFILTTAPALAPVTIQTGNTVLQAGVKRFGINLGGQNFYDSGMMMKNLIYRNPGFEAEIYQSVIRCGSGSVSSCTDDNPYSGWAANFFTGATFEIIYGSATGRTGTINSSTRADGSTGAIFGLSGSGAAPALGDYMIVRRTVPGNAVSGWWPSTNGGGVITTNTSDLPPGTSGLQTVALNAPAYADQAVLTSYFDATDGKTFIQLNGNHQISFKAKGLGGAKTVGVQLSREGTTTTFNQTVSLSSEWANYTVNVPLAEDGSYVGRAHVAFTATGPDAFLLDDVSLVQLNGDPTNTTVFRDPVVNTLKALNPGVMRFWYNQLGETMDNFIADPYGRQRSGYSAFTVEADFVSYNLHEFLQLCEAIGAEPWVVVPIVFKPAEASNLIDYLTGSTSTVYGAKRAALGHPAPWTFSFSKIHLEFGNEAWNASFKGGTIEYQQPYGQRAQTIFAAMRANTSYVASSFDLVLGGQFIAPGRNQGIQESCNNNDSFTVAPYLMTTVDSFTDQEDLYGSTFAEAEAFAVATGSAEGQLGVTLQNLQAIAVSGRSIPLSVYETNMGTVLGSITQPGLNSYVSSIGAGIGVIDSMLQQVRQGVTVQNMFTLPQYTFNRTDGKSVYMWGVVVDMGVTDRKRPQYLAMQLANQAIPANASMLQTTHTGSDPTWDQPMSNLVQLTGAHYLQSFAFAGSGTYSMVVLNLHRTSSLPITFGGANVPNGSVQIRQLTSSQINDTNEASNLIVPTSTITSGFNASTPVYLPPFSMTSFTWAAPANAAPLISGLTYSGITPTSAVVSWTTDVASSTQVAYGPSTTYASTSTLNPALTTSHLTTLTGLTPGATYNFAAKSTSAAGVSSTSDNSSFSTPALPSPQVSAVTASNVTPTAATITWNTDQTASTQVQYGLTASYGTLSPIDSGLTTSHTVTLSGLAQNTLYYYSALSVNSAGASSTSANYFFNTPAAPPVVTAVASTTTSNSATITWTTDTPATSQVEFGFTAAHGILTAFDANKVTSHSLTIPNLTPATGYSYGVLSTNVLGATNVPGNFTFTTGAVPVISQVISIGVTNNTATITWTTDQPTTSLVSYGFNTNYALQSTVSPTLSTTHSVSLTGLVAGTLYNFAVSSANAAGTAVTSANFTFATSGVPAISAIAVSAITTTSATITWTTDQNSTTQVAYGITSPPAMLSTPITTLTTTHTAALSGLAPGTMYNYTVMSTNSAGATTASSIFTFMTATPGPVISALTATAITGTSATITWTTDIPATSQVNYGTTSTTLNPALSTSHAVALTGLTASTSYTYAAVSGTTTSASATFVTLAPVITALSATAISTTSATVSWTTDVPATTQVSYGTTTTTLNTALTTVHSVALTGLTPNTVYNFVAISGTTSASAAFTTLAPAPVITALTATAITTTGASITWTTDIPATTQLTYGTTTTTLNPALTTIHSVALTGLTPNTVYNYGAISGTTSASATFTTLAPAPVITALTATAITTTSASITWTTDIPATTQLTYGTTTTTLNPALTTIHSVALTGLTPNTVYNYVATSGTTSASATFTTLAPAPVITALTATAITTTGASITWTTDIPATTQLTYGTTTTTLNPALTTVHSVALTGLTPGTTYTYSASSANAGGTSTTSNNATFATLAPPVVSAIAATGITATSATITWTTDQLSNTQVNFGTSTAYGSQTLVNSSLTTTHSAILTGLVPGTLYNFSALSINAAGIAAAPNNTIFATASTPAPIITNLNASNVSATSATITWTTDIPSTSLVNTLSTLDSTLTTNHTVSLSNLTVGTLYTFTVSSTSALGASSTSAAATFTTLAVPPPVISAVAAWPVAATTASILWTTDQSSTSLVNFGLTTALGSQATAAGLNIYHVVSLSNLTPGTTYTYQTSSANSSGVSSKSVIISFTTSGTPAFTISAVAAFNITTTSATISWTTDAPSTSQVFYGTTSSYGSQSAVNPALSTAHSVTLSGLAPGLNYNFAVLSTNPSSITQASSNATFTTLAGVAPVISAVTATSISATSATISWTTDLPSTTQVSYGTTSAYGTLSASNLTLATTHTVTLIGLTPSTFYNYAAISSATTSSNFTFTTAVPPPPTITAVAATSITSTAATITWTTDQLSSSQVNYNSSQSPLNATPVTTHAVTLTGLTASTVYTYSVVSGVTTSAFFTFTTTAPAAPVISAVSASAITTTGATITWTTDIPATTQVTYGASTTVLNPSLSTAHSATLTGLTASTAYTYTVKSSNSTGATTTSNNFTFTTAAPPPVISAVAASNITASTATITWTTDIPATTQLAYNTLTTTLNTTLTTAHAVQLTGLSPSTVYSYSAISGTTTATAAAFTTTNAPAPIITNLTASNVSATSATITWTTDIPSTSLVNTLSTLDSTLTTNHTVSLSNLTVGSLYTFTVSSTSALGASSTSAAATFTTLAVPPPVISAVAAWPVAATTASILWTTDQSSTSLVNFGLTTALGSQATAAGLNIYHVVSLSNLTPGTTYTYQTSSANSSGVSSKSVIISFTTSGTPAFTISAVAAFNITTTSATISWTTDAPSTSQVFYGTTSSYGSQSAVNPALSTAHSVTLSGLAPGLNYNFAVLSTNPSSITQASSNATFTTLAGVAPVISAVTATSISATSATISWTTDLPSTTQVSYGTTSAYGTLSASNPTLATTHTVTLIGLTPSTFYNYAAISSATTSSNFTFTTAVPPPPTITAVAATSITSTAATITWTTDQLSSSQVNYNSSQSPLNATPVTTHAVTLSGLTASTIYTYSVVSGVTTSAFFTFTTTAPAAPVISAVSASAITTTGATITWTTDIPATTQVTYGASTTVLNPSLTTAHSATLTGLTTSTAYTYTVKSSNSTGATTTSNNFTFTTAAPPPVISAVAASNITASTATITWTTDIPATTQLAYNTLTTTLNTTLTTAHAVQLTGLSPSTVYSYSAISGTTTATAAAFTTTNAPAPIITNLTASNVSATSATITWTTDIPSTSLVNTLSTLDSTLTTNHTVSLSNLTVGTLYTFTVSSTSALGASSTSAAATFTTLAVPPPVISAVAAWPVAATTASILWTTDQSSTSLVNFGLTTALGSQATAAGLNIYHVVSLSNLTPGTTYTYQTSSANSSGVSSKSVIISFTTSGTPAFTISAVAAFNITTTSATISWTTDAPSTSQVFYGTTTSYGSQSAVNPALSTAHSVTLSGLAPGLNYNFAVLSTNPSSITQASSNATFTTLAGVAPVISAVTATSISATSATISWTTDLPSTTQVSYGTTSAYGTLSASNPTLATTHTVTLIGLTPSTFYNYAAISSATTSSNFTFTTAVPPPPTITAVAATSITSTAATITWTTDQLSSSQVNYNSSQSPLNATPVTTHAVTLSGLTASTIYTYSVVSGVTTSAFFTFTTTAPAAPVISAVSASAITTTGATITWTTDIPATTQVTYGASTTVLNPSLSTAHSATLTGLTASTAYTYTVKSSNSTGATTTSNNFTFTTAAPPPVISAVAASNITASTATITWTTDIPATTQLAYNSLTTTLNTTLTTAHAVQLTGLSPSTVYSYSAISGTTTATAAAFTTTNAPAPIITNLTASNVSATSATITWTTDIPSTSLVNTLSTLDSTLTTNHTVSLSNLTVGTLYTFTVSSTSALGASSTSAAATFTTLAVPAPVITSLAAWPVNATTASIVWTTDQNATSVVNFGLTPAYGSQATSAGLNIYHLVSLSNLTPGTTYHYQGISANSAGVAANSVDISFTTTGTAPFIISAVAATNLTTSTATITWTTSQPTTTQVAYGTTVNYSLQSQLDSALSTTHSVALTGLTPATAYFFAVLSTSGGGVTLASANATFTTH